MIKALFLTIALLCYGQVLMAQDLQEKLQFLKDNTATVTGKKKTFEQQFSTVPDHPYIVSVKITETGSGDEIIKSVNLQDLNPSRVVFEPKRDMVEISAKVKADKKLVKIVENQQTQNYDNELLFYATGIEEARALSNALESSVEIADKDNQTPNAEALGKDQLLGYLTESTVEVTINDETFQQEFSFDQDNNNIIGFEIENLTKGLKEEYQVNAADLYLSKIDFDTRRNQVLVSIKTKADAKLISYQKDGEIGNFTNEIEILMPSIEHGRSYVAHLKQLVKIAESEETIGYQDYTAKQCQEILTNEIGQVIINQDSYQQGFSVDPNIPFIFRITSKDVSKGEEITYSVNAAYLHPGKTQFNTKGNTVLVTLETDDNRKLISTRRGEESANYTHTILLRAQDIEKARNLSAVFTRYKELARTELEQQSAFAGVQDAEQFIQESVGKLVVNTDTYVQSVKTNPDNSCLNTYQFTDVSKDVQYDYEFNFQDLDQHKIQFDTKGVQCYVSAEVRGKNKLIKTYKDGEADKFVYQLQILSPDIEQARMLVEALKIKSEACRE